MALDLVDGFCDRTNIGMRTVIRIRVVVLKDKPSCEDFCLDCDTTSECLLIFSFNIYGLKTSSSERARLFTLSLLFVEECVRLYFINTIFLLTEEPLADKVYR
jgi:hypothetical protein